MVPSKTLAVALVEQLGSVLAVGLYIVAMQHIFMTSILSKPDESWFNRARSWWSDERLRAEKRRLSLWTQMITAEEPSAAERRLQED